MRYQTINDCRICSGKVKLVLDLGNQPLANNLQKNLNIVEDFAPLRLGICSACGHVQLMEDVDPSDMFSHYLWVTGTSGVTRQYAKEFSRKLLDSCSTKSPKVIELASNDCTFLKEFLGKSKLLVGVDPAKNIIESNQIDGISQENMFFDFKNSEKLKKRYRNFDIVFARNVLPHVPDPVNFLKGMKNLLSEKGILVVEFHSSRIILEELHFDSIYHEHYSYFSLSSLISAANKIGIYVFDINYSPISGGSIVAYFSLDDKKAASDVLMKEIETENRLKITKQSAWDDFAIRARNHCEKFRVELLNKNWKNIIGYGASARSSTFLNFCGIDSSIIKAIIDKSN
jgi:SAM-dependent methyltransferase